MSGLVPRLPHSFPSLVVRTVNDGKLDGAWGTRLGQPFSESSRLACYSFYTYPCIQSAHVHVLPKSGRAKTRPARPLATAMQLYKSLVIFSNVAFAKRVNTCATIHGNCMMFMSP